MSSFFEAPRDPVDLSFYRATVPHEQFDHDPEDERQLADLEYAASQFDMLGKRYFIEAGQGFVLPRRFDAQQPVTYIKLDSMMVEGEFSTYSRISIGRFINGPDTVRALCIALGSATILPYFEDIDEQEMLHIPILAVDSISQS